MNSSSLRRDRARTRRRREPGQLKGSGPGPEFSPRGMSGKREVRSLPSRPLRVRWPRLPVTEEAATHRDCPSPSTGRLGVSLQGARRPALPASCQLALSPSHRRLPQTYHQVTCGQDRGWCVEGSFATLWGGGGLRGERQGQGWGGQPSAGTRRAQARSSCEQSVVPSPPRTPAALACFRDFLQVCFSICTITHPASCCNLSRL